MTSYERKVKFDPRWCREDADAELDNQGWYLAYGLMRTFVAVRLIDGLTGSVQRRCWQSLFVEDDDG